MKQAILHIIYPAKRPDGTITYNQSTGLEKVSRIAKEQCKKSEGLESLGEYAWLISLDSDLPTLCHLISNADSYNLSYRITYLDNVLEWDLFNPETPLSNT